MLQLRHVSSILATMQMFGGAGVFTRLAIYVYMSVHFCIFVVLLHVCLHANWMNEYKYALLWVNDRLRAYKVTAHLHMCMHMCVCAHSFALDSCLVVLLCWQFMPQVYYCIFTQQHNRVARIECLRAEWMMRWRKKCKYMCAFTYTLRLLLCHL